MNTQSELYPLISSIITTSYSLVSFLGIYCKCDSEFSLCWEVCLKMFWEGKSLQFADCLSVFLNYHVI